MTRFWRRIKPNARGPADISRKYGLRSLAPASLGLPLFTDDQQANRAKAQLQRIGARLKQKIAFFDNVIFAMQAMEWAGTAASFALAGGILYQAAKQGGKVFLIKSVAMAASAVAGKAVGAATGAALKAIGVEG